MSVVDRLLSLGSSIGIVRAPERTNEARNRGIIQSYIDKEHDMRELRLWQVEISTNIRGSSPARASHFSKRHMVNVAARDIRGAIEGALEELRERYGKDWDEDHAWVMSANHRGAVNRIVE